MWYTKSVNRTLKSCNCCPVVVALWFNTTSMRKPIYKGLEIYKGFYTVSDDGRVFSEDREIYFINKYGKTSVRKYKGMELKRVPDKDGYLKVTLSKNRRSKTVSVHHLVANHFLKKGKKTTQINHKNNIRNDNRVENLEWVTPKENTQHMINQNRGCFSGEKHPRARFKNKDILKIRLLKEAGDYTNKKIAEKFSCHESTIQAILSGRQWSSVKIKQEW